MKGSAEALPPPDRVLIVKPSALGDVVTALPVLRGLRRTFPDARIDWLVRDIYAPLIARDPQLDGVVTYDRRLLGRFWRPGEGMRHARRLKRTLREARYDWAIDLQGLLRSALFCRATRASVRAGFADAREGAPLLYTHRFDLLVEQYHTVDRNIELARRLGVDARSEDFTLHVSDAARDEAHRLLSEMELDRDRFLACVPPTRWTTKNYPVRHWRSVLASLADDIPVVVLGGPGDRQLCEDITRGIGGAGNLAGRTDLPAMVGILSAARAVICCDSAAKFIAQATGVPPVVLVGPTRVHRTGPYPSSSVPGREIVADVPCQGCLKKQCSHGTCMQLVRPDRVVEQARELLEETCPGQS